MFVSIVVCTYSLNNYQNLKDAVDNLLNQTHKEMEIIIVVDGNQELYEKIVKAYNNQKKIKVIASKENIGSSGVRNIGIKASRGNVIAFMDDDAIAERRWIENLVNTYYKFDAIAVGGKILPAWLCKQPDYFPDELGWLVGITNKGFAQEKVIEVRNTFGSNMSFKMEVFEKIGLFNEKFGFAKRGTSHIQAEEVEFSLRMKNKLGKGVIYNPEAIVYHKIPQSKVKVKMLLKRAFYQGYSKAIIKKNFIFLPESLTTEKSYLKSLFSKHIPQRIKFFFTGSNRIADIKQLSFLVTAIFTVGFGFMCGYMKKGQ